jgi:HEPN domain-containing protein
MADPVIVKEWLEKAGEDFNFAAANLREGSSFYAQLCFHFQQSAEKYLKAYIIARGLPFDRVHDLVHLLKTCSAHEPAFNNLIDECIYLNAAYIETRYPVHWPTDYTKETAEQAHLAASRIADMVHEELGMSMRYPY